MFVCSVYKTEFGHLTSLINHKKVHKSYCQVEDDTDTSSNKSTDIYSSDESEIIYKQNNNPDPISNIQNETQTIANEASEFDESNQMSENNILENYNISKKIYSDDSELGDTNSAEFPNTAYKDFIDILSYKAGDAILKYIQKHGNISKKMLP
ncbi:2303_t:CDS:2 [Cetraspora pellucida]|uniref:2303_t:CDS:1 n=1 Tax=Cetraspora pellucida TaxID=1433469 RepID=A0ACA9MPF7_9GLOM|nr:2303_t:CDS:2 [Cetraspora pellucida]